MSGLLHKGRVLWSKFSVVGAGTYASSIAYFTFLSLVPLFALCISLVSITGLGEQEVATFFASFVPEALEGIVKTLVNEAFERSGVAFSLSTATLLWSASKGIKALRAGLNATYSVKETRSAPVVAFLSIATVVILGILMSAMMYLVFGDSTLRSIAKNHSDLRQLSNMLDVLNPLAVLASGILILGACYAYLPNGTRRIWTQLPGAVFATCACGVLSFGFRVYVDHYSNYTVLYGSIATVALLLFWMYLVAYILLVGRFVNRLLAEKNTDPVDRMERN